MSGNTKNKQKPDSDKKAPLADSQNPRLNDRGKPLNLNELIASYEGNLEQAERDIMEAGCTAAEVVTKMAALSQELDKLEAELNK